MIPSAAAMAVPAVTITDSDLVASIRIGEKSAFELLYRDHYETLCHYALRWVESPAVAEDVVQDVFLRIWRRRTEWYVEGPLTAYLYAAVRNGALNRVRGARVRQLWAERTEREQLLDGPAMGGEEADGQLRADELQQAIEAAIADLAPRCREAFVLRRRHHLSYAEIATIMDIAPKTVEVQIGLALRTLRQKLQEWL